jgi:hypothetical protein
MTAGLLLAVGYTLAGSVAVLLKQRGVVATRREALHKPALAQPDSAARQRRR